MSTIIKDAPNDGSSRGWILYDGSCGFCSWWVPYWSKTLASRGFGFAALQDNWVQTTLKLPDTELIRDIRLLLPDGSQVFGADVYRKVMRHIWWAWPLYIVSVLPGFSCIFDYCYKIFNKNRSRISNACGLPPRKST